MTYNHGKKLTPQGEKRLKILASINSLGQGFSLASQDLDIRGAGNLLGEEQSGEIREVGYELYQSMLQGAIEKLKLDGQTQENEQQSLSPKLDLNVPVLIPEHYVGDLGLRLSLYRELALLQDWTANIDEILQYLNGGTDSVLGVLRTDNKIGTIFDGISDSFFSLEENSNKMYQSDFLEIGNFVSQKFLKTVSTE